jgi:sulfite reductase (ferredoxin)
VTALVAKIITAPSRGRHRISLHDDVYNKLKDTAASQGKTMTELANAALKIYLEMD